MKKLLDLLSTRTVFLSYFFVILVFMISLQHVRSSLVFEILQITVIFSAVIFILIKPRFNLANSFYGFVIIFLGFCPLIEFRLGIIYWGGSEIDTSTYIITSIMVIISLFMFQLGYMLKFKKPKVPVNFKNCPNIIAGELSKHITTICFLALVLPCAYLLQQYDYNLLALQFRGLAETMPNVFVFEFFFIKPLIFNIIFLSLFLMIQYKSISFLKVFFLITIMLFFVGPLSMPRFLTFSLYIPLVFVLLDWYRKKDCKYIGTVIFGMILIFPFLDLFRWFRVDNRQFDNVIIDINYFLVGHFDAFQNFARIIMLDVHTYGEQFLGALLFFFPRSIWLTKPVGSGFLLAESAGLSFNNISVPLIAELYLDFFIPGIILGFFLLGALYKYIDNRFDNRRGNFGLLDAVKLIAYVEFICLQYYLLRGNLLACTAFVCSILASVFVAYVLVLIFKFVYRFICYGIR